jgi:hypothetical protein
MPPPKLLPVVDLERIQSVSPEIAAQYLQSWLEVTKLYEKAAVEQMADDIANSRHKRLYSILSLSLGTFPATISLGVCLYGIHQGTNLLSLAAMIGPVAGLAGVFVWGYRPKS